MAEPDIVLVWRVTEACPLACPFCGYSRDLVFPRASADPRAVEHFGHILSEVQQVQSRSILVSWLGGEPLVWSELPKLARRFKQDFGLCLGVTTSGHTLSSEAVRQELLAHYDQLTVSIDAIGERHDQLRGMTGLFESLRESLAALCRADTRHHLWRRVNTVLMRDNIRQFDRLCEVMADWQFHELTFNALGGNERPDYYRDHRLLPEQIEEFVDGLPALRQRMASRKLLIRGTSRYLHRLAASTQNHQIAIDDCQPGRQFLFIDAQGRISPCSFTSVEYGIKITDVRTVADFLALEQQFREKRQRLRVAACGDCHATHVFAKFGASDAPSPPVSPFPTNLGDTRTSPPAR